MNTWRLLSENQLADLMRFLCTREQYCTNFTERLLNGGRAVHPNGADVSVAVRTGPTGEIDGAILQTRSGVFHPVLGDTGGTVERQAIDLLRRRSRRMYSVMGRTRDVNAFEEAVRRSPRQSIEYHLMGQEAAPPESALPQLPSGFQISRSHVADAALLAGLQRDYEIEEVLLPGNTFDPVGSMKHLRHALATQLIVHGAVNGSIIAKAGTNARGALYDQIGGVFTDPAYRSRGVATALMLRVLSMVAAEHKSASLFVKMDNGPALSLYQNLGFRVLDGFRISYYR